jgi:hypothetical protein
MTHAENPDDYAPNSRDFQRKSQTVQHDLSARRETHPSREEENLEWTRTRKSNVIFWKRANPILRLGHAPTRVRMRESRVAIRGLLRDGGCSNSDEIIFVCFSERITCARLS